MQSGFHEAAGLKRRSRPNRGLKAALAAPPLHPTIRAFAGNNLGSQPGAGAPSGPPKGEAHCISKKLAVLVGDCEGDPRLDQPHEQTATRGAQLNSPYSRRNPISPRSCWVCSGVGASWC